MTVSKRGERVTEYNETEVTFPYPKGDSSRWGNNSIPAHSLQGQLNVGGGGQLNDGGEQLNA